MGMYDYVKLEPLLRDKVLELCPSINLSGLQSKCGPCELTDLFLGETLSYTVCDWERVPNPEFNPNEMASLANMETTFVRVNERIVSWDDDFKIHFYGGGHDFTAYYRDGKFHKLVMHPPFNP